MDIETLATPVATWLRCLPPDLRKARFVTLGKALDDDQVFRLLLSGVHGFVEYQDAENDLIPAIDAVRKGCFWVKSSVLERVAGQSGVTSRTCKGRRERLTRREKQILRLLPNRPCNKEIASALGISERTVRFHLANIFTKLGVHDRYSAADFATAKKVDLEVD